jgi:hypothetical protein
MDKKITYPPQALSESPHETWGFSGECPYGFRERETKQKESASKHEGGRVMLDLLHAPNDGYHA